MLAKKTGLTVRTLHYYEEIGLLFPSSRSEKGYRLYGIEEVQRLQKILSLQQLGFSLEDIRLLLDEADYSLPRVLDMHLTRLQEQIRIQQELLTRLKTISERLCGEGDLSIEEFIQSIRVMNMYENYYSPEQLEQLKNQGDALGKEGMSKAQSQWDELSNAFRAEMEKGTDPADEKVQALVAQMKQLIHAFTGGDPEIERSLGKMYEEEGPEKASRGVIDKALFDYMGKARDIAGW